MLWHRRLSLMSFGLMVGKTIAKSAPWDEPTSESAHEFAPHCGGRLRKLIPNKLGFAHSPLPTLGRGYVFQTVRSAEMQARRKDELPRRHFECHGHHGESAEGTEGHRRVASLR